MSETRKIFAQNLLKLIEQSGIEQIKIARDLDVSPSIVSAWVNGIRFPRANTMQILADYFNVTVSDLVGEHLDGAPDYRERMRRSPGMRTLFDAANGSTEEELKRYADMIKTLRKSYDDD